MALSTKKALAASFNNILRGKPLSKITISDITRDCGVNRMTFYYHFEDIYDLIEWACTDAAKTAFEKGKADCDGQYGLTQVFDCIYENRVFISKICCSMGRESVEKFINKLSYGYIYETVESFSADKKLSEENKKCIAEFYNFAFTGYAVNWIDRNMPEKTEIIAARLDSLIRLGIRSAVDGYPNKT
ncbi:MAG: TetR-like C-terminal domain-containing protein [Clostridia bacterium]|nr:TetR-like C-terminal domain-containing protein [Clostridia bacterium]